MGQNIWDIKIPNSIAQLADAFTSGTSRVYTTGSPKPASIAIDLGSGFGSNPDKKNEINTLVRTLALMGAEIHIDQAHEEIFDTENLNEDICDAILKDANIHDVHIPQLLDDETSNAIKFFNLDAVEAQSQDVTLRICDFRTITNINTGNRDNPVENMQSPVSINKTPGEIASALKTIIKVADDKQELTSLSLVRALDSIEEQALKITFGDYLPGR